MLDFFQAPNLKVATLTQGQPWDFQGDEQLIERWRENKDLRKAEMKEEKTRWNIYSAVGGLAPNLRVSDENPATVIRGIVADYDVKQAVSNIEYCLNQFKPQFMPNFIESTLSGNARLVWVFEREILCPSSSFAKTVLDGFIEKLGARKILPGFDEASIKPAEVWTNGAQWYEINPTPMPRNETFGILATLSKKFEFGRLDIPLAIIADERERRFPGRWKGPFDLDNMGVRFWDETADSQTGCQVKPDGMLCFTGRAPFMSWDKVFGAAWCNKQRALNLGNAAGDTFFDSHRYWEKQSGLWVHHSREDVLLNLKTRGISNKAGKGQTASDAEQVLNFIQKSNRVYGAASLINHKPGIIMHDDNRVLNISTIRALTPSEKTGITPGDFPWTWKFLNGLFDHPELQPLDYFLAWLRRTYYGALNYKKLMGQAVFLCGPKENGKTLLCYRYLKPMLGNKIANPYPYFTGATPFSDDLFETHLLAINDEEATTREDARQKFIASIKSFVVNPSHSYHPKYCKRMNIEWTGRVFVTLNDDPASVGLLPEVNQNTADKLMYFGSRPYGGDWDDQNVIEARIEQELPYFARWLLDWQPPKEVLTPGRMGVKSFFDPRILEFSQQQGPAYVLMELIKIWCTSGAYWDDTKQEWTGTASELINQFSVTDHLHTLLKGWDSLRTAKSLTTLARSGMRGVEFVNGQGRLFRITRKEVEEGK